MRINVGYPEFINDETELNKRYETFNVKGTKANAVIIFVRESTAKIGLEKHLNWAYLTLNSESIGDVTPKLKGIVKNLK